jgi:soluble cytochrome b562
MFSKSKFAFLSLLVLTLALSGAGWALAADEHDHKHSDLEETMEKANKALKLVKADIADASKNTTTLAAVGEMQKHFLAGKTLIPAKAAKLSGPAKDKFVMEYRKAMIGLMGELLKLEGALLDGKNDQAAEIVKNLGKIKADGHEKFQEE